MQPGRRNGSCPAILILPARDIRNFIFCGRVLADESFEFPCTTGFQIVYIRERRSELRAIIIQVNFDLNLGICLFRVIFNVADHISQHPVAFSAMVYQLEIQKRLIFLCSCRIDI